MGARAAQAPATAEDFLARALLADTPAARAKWARQGLAFSTVDLTPDTQVLLLRQIYLARLEAGQFRKAVEVAQQMAAVGPLRDIAHHDCARAFSALGMYQEAFAAQRLAARHAPPARRSFQLWSLATLQHFHGSGASALRTLARAERWAHRDRVLIRAHAAFIRLTRGKAVPELDQRIAELQRSPAREGYGQWVLGMIAHEIGDERSAAVHLRAFLRRHASADPAKALTLREELSRARAALASIESN